MKQDVQRMNFMDYLVVAHLGDSLSNLEQSKITALSSEKDVRDIVGFKSSHIREPMILRAIFKFHSEDNVSSVVLDRRYI